MRFTDGHWPVRDGMLPLHPARGHDVWADDATMTVDAPTARITRRCDTLNRPLVVGVEPATTRLELAV